MSKSDDTQTMIHIENSIISQIERDNIVVNKDQLVGLNIIKNIIKTKKLMLHGGLAVNAILPKKKRFYDENSIPDYDALIPDDTGKETKKIMFAAQRKLTEADYWAHFQPAIHGNTQKLRSHPKGITRLAALRYPNIFDATSVPKTDFKKLLDLSETENKLRPPEYKQFTLVPTAWMKLSFHLEFSRPSVHIRRWAKLYPRSLSIYETYPYVVLGKKSKYEPLESTVPTDLTASNALQEEFGDTTFLVGEYVANKIMGKDKKGAVDIVTKELVKAHDFLYDKGLEPDEILPETTFLPERFLVGTSTVYKWEECTSVVNGGKFGNSDAVLRYLYGEYIENGKTSLIDDLTAFQLKLSAEQLGDTNLKSRFGIVCK
jgi:hypothetical protein